MYIRLSLPEGDHDLAVLVRLHQQCLDSQKRMESKINKMETLLSSGLNDLKKILEEKERRSFSIKDSGYEV